MLFPQLQLLILVPRKKSIMTLLLTQELYRLSPLPLHEFENYRFGYSYYDAGDVSVPWYALYTLGRCRGDRKELAQLLVLSGFNLNNTLLKAVSESFYNEEYRPLIPTLLDIGANPNIINDSGETLLHIASRNSDSGTTVRTLLNHRATLDTRDQAGFTPLHRAITFSQLENARELLERGQIPISKPHLVIHLSI